MPKRKNYDSKIQHYERKIRKLEEKAQRQIRILSSDSNNSDNEHDGMEVQEEPTRPDIATPVSADVLNPDPPLDPPRVEENTVPEIIELDPDILLALGQATEESPKFGPMVHDSLARLWNPILRKGLDKESRDKLLKKYLIPENCPLLQAAKLNPEIMAAISEATRTRDKRVEGVQQQLGVGIAALNKGLELLLDNEVNKVEAIKFLSDSSRLLCDLHHTETEARKKFITPGLDKSFLNIIQDLDRDDMIFGSKLSEKIKASKVIEKQGLQIKKIQPAPKPSAPPQPTALRTQAQGNWSAPPRYISNRGRRGVARRGARGRPLAAMTITKPNNHNKQRAPNQQL